MIYGVYAIRDSKTGFLTPTVDINDQSAARNFEHAALQSNTLFFSHPADYDLYKIGSFDTDSGLLQAFSAPDFIIAGTAFKED